jgi:type IV secretory pathway TraG/TraD family ATPase VirD4
LLTAACCRRELLFFFMDEFAALGQLEIIETTWALVRG